MQHVYSAPHAPQNCLALHAPLVECVFYDYWSGATEVEATNNADVRLNDVSGAYPTFKVRLHSETDKSLNNRASFANRDGLAVPMHSN